MLAPIRDCWVAPIAGLILAPMLAPIELAPCIGAPMAQMLVTPAGAGPHYLKEIGLEKVHGSGRIGFPSGGFEPPDG